MAQVETHTTTTRCSPMSGWRSDMRAGHVLHASLAMAALVLGPSVARADSAADEAATKLAVHVCASCHGPGGNSTSPTFPKLAAQQEPYLVAQINAFKSGKRGEKEAHDYMLGMTTLIDDATAAALGRYFARQPPAAGEPGDPQQVARGKQLFEQGAEGKVVACATCHGAHAEGNGIFPRLAGQHAPYVVKQLKVIQSNLRQSPVMHGIITKLTSDDMADVAAYVQSL
ncbi:cytochrome c4 [Dyella solisilvae]|uniref:Cytochrome c4 n=1 Tax=Dyella solisilvae TaxID=1920168 RepID=A0A370K4H5_9GAMM|nr:c-type cytochrome [Dyella solisilvae]RDI97552.1 cytochrome c4 [Dyella solisilvae]